MYDWHWEVLSQYTDVFLQGALVTMGLTLLVILIGTALGICVGLMRKSENLITANIARAYTELFRALPILVLLIWIFYVAPMLWDIRLSPFAAACLALSVNLSAYIAETIRSGIEAIPKTQYESGITLGLTPLQVMLRIIFPQTLRIVLPNILGLYITQLKNTSLASIIAVNELLHRSNSVISNTYRPLEIYTAVALIYLAFILPATACAQMLEQRMSCRVRHL